MKMFCTRVILHFKVTSQLIDNDVTDQNKDRLKHDSVSVATDALNLAGKTVVACGGH